MGTNKGNTQLIILIDKEKREALKSFANQQNVSMASLVNQLIDGLLVGNFEVEGKPASSIDIKAPSISAEEVTELINQAISPIEKRLTTAEGMANLQIEEISELKKPLAVN